MYVQETVRTNAKLHCITTKEGLRAELLLTFAQLVTMTTQDPDDD